MKNQIINELYQTLKNRKKANPDTSYVASLYANGLEKITRKVMEEAFETVQAAEYLQAGKVNRQAFIGELADLWFHVLVLACERNIELEEITTELEKRMGKSGLVEKQNRSKKQSS